MNNEEELFELKKAFIQQSFDTKKYSGIYYPGIHDLEVNVNEITYPQAVISYIHESIHYVLHNFNFGVFQLDYLILFLSLVYFSTIYKSEKIDEYLIHKNITDDEEKKRYMFVNYLEIDEYLARDQKYVDFLKFCISIYDIYFYAIINSTLINESLATYVSLNINSSYHLYIELKLKDFFYDELVSKEIKRVQEIEKQKIINFKKQNIYSIGYKHAEELVNKFGVEKTLGLADFIFKYVPVYNFDLIGSSSNERKNILDKYFNLDKIWRQLIDLDISDIFMNNSYDFRDDAPLHICGYLLDDLPMVEIKAWKSNWSNLVNNMADIDSIPKSVFHAYNRIYLHPHIIHKIEKLNEAKINIVEMMNALNFANRLLNDPKFTGVYDFVKEKEDIIIDERIKRFPELYRKSNSVYANKQIQQYVSTMDTIILINKNIRR